MKDKNNMENNVYMGIVLGVVGFLFWIVTLMELMSQFCNMSVEMQSFKYVTYQSDSAKESKNICLVKSQVQMIIACFPLTCSVSTYTYFKGHILIWIWFSWQQLWVCDFLMEFYKKIEQYVQHVHIARWKDEQYRKCRDKFPIWTILSILDFAENYTL